MNEQSCPVCKSDSYLNPNIKILISPCFHKLCEQCVYRIFSQGFSPCPTCQTQLRRINYISSTFEDIEVEKEVRLRKLLHKHFNRKEAEFSDIQEYNDYLEEFEDLVFELLEYNNENQIKEKISSIKNSESILNKIIIEQKLENKEIKIKEEINQYLEEYKKFINSIENQTPNIKVQNIPVNLLVANECGGLTNKIICEIFTNSLFLIDE